MNQKVIQLIPDLVPTGPARNTDPRVAALDAVFADPSKSQAERDAACLDLVLSFHGPRERAKYYAARQQRVIEAPTIAPAVAIAARPPVPDFPYAAAHEFVKGPPMSWLVKGVIPKAELGMVYGASGSGKSFFCADLAVHMAAGLAWRGKRTKRVRVAYIAAEGAVGFKSRLRATAQHLGVTLTDLQLWVFGCAPNFVDDAQAAKLKEQLAALKPDAVFVDTLARVSAGADENSGKDMGKVLEHCKAIQEKSGALVLIIHHSGKNAALGARGWSGIKAACDVEIEVSKDGRTTRVAELSKQKDGADGEKFGFHLSSAEVVDEDGLAVKDEDGEQVWSCYVTPVEVAEAPKAASRKFGDVEKLVMQAAAELCGVVGHADEGSIVELVASRMARGNAKRDQRKRRAAEAITSLAADELLAVHDGKVSTCAV
jgi:archaellum biogenesis ATPase FlaH